MTATGLIPASGQGVNMLKFLDRWLNRHAQRGHEKWLKRSHVILPAPHHSALRGTPEAVGRATV